MKETYCPFLETRDDKSALVENGARLDTSCRVDCIINGAAFLSRTGGYRSLSKVTVVAKKAMKDVCPELNKGKNILEALKNLSDATNQSVSP